VGLHGLGRHDEAIGDLSVRQPLGDEPEHLSL
jgi:hypothetical protein